jgi:hypothetical protein
MFQRFLLFRKNRSIQRYRLCLIIQKFLKTLRPQKFQRYLTFR